MWSFEVLANITSMFSLYCNSTKNRNINVTCLVIFLALDGICINIKILISSFGKARVKPFLSEALTAVLLR